MDVTDESNDAADPEEPDVSIGAAPEAHEPPAPTTDQRSWEPPEADRGGWKATAQALNVMYVCNIALVMMGLLMGVIAVAGGEQVPNADSLASDLIGVTGLIVIGLGFGILFAYLRVLWVPKASGAHPKAIGAAACIALVSIMAVVKEFAFSDFAGAEDPAAAVETMLILKSIGDLAYMAATLFMVLLLKTVAAHLGESELTATASTLLKLFAGLIIVILLTTVPKMMNPEPDAQPSALILVGALAMVGLGLVCLVKYLRLLRGVRDAIRFSLKAG